MGMNWFFSRGMVGRVVRNVMHSSRSAIDRQRGRWCRSKFELGMAWLRDGSKRDPPAAQADSFAEANRENASAAVGMTGLGGLVRSAPRTTPAHRARPGSHQIRGNALGVEKVLFAPSRSSPS